MFNLTAWQKLCFNFQKLACSHGRNIAHILSRFNHRKGSVPPQEKYLHCHNSIKCATEWRLSNFVNKYYKMQYFSVQLFR